jgi:hypothetical protein
MVVHQPPANVPPPPDMSLTDDTIVPPTLRSQVNGNRRNPVEPAVDAARKQ